MHSLGGILKAEPSFPLENPSSRKDFELIPLCAGTFHIVSGPFHQWTVGPLRAGTVSCLQPLHLIQLLAQERCSLNVSWINGFSLTLGTHGL